MASSGQKHVMLSYNHGSKDIVTKIYHILVEAGIPTWIDTQHMGDDLNNSMAKAVENAEVVCCFMTSKYQESPACKKELEYAESLERRIIPCMLVDKKEWQASGWLGLITRSKLYVNFCNTTEANIRTKVNELITRIKNQPSASATQSLPSSNSDPSTDSAASNASVPKDPTASSKPSTKPQAVPKPRMSRLIK